MGGTRTSTLTLARVEQPGGATSMRRTFVASTEQVASDRGIIRAAGWRFARYAKNPVLLWVHRRDMLPIGKGAGWRLDLARREMLLDVDFPPPGEHPFADTVRRMFDLGFLRAVSVSWETLREEPPTPEEQAAGARWVSAEQELVEVSVVPVPADAGAVDVTGSGRALAARALGMGEGVDAASMADTLRTWAIQMQEYADLLDPAAGGDAAPGEPGAHGAPQAAQRGDGGGAQGAAAVQGGAVEPVAPAAAPAALDLTPLLAAATRYAQAAFPGAKQ